MKRYLIIAISVLVFLFLWMFRFSIYVGPSYTYKLDRWSGNVTVFWGTHELPMHKKGSKVSGYLKLPSDTQLDNEKTEKNNPGEETPTQRR